MKEKNAYLTVEAVLVMPMVLGVIVLTIYLMFFQYDRCLMEQDMGILALRACTLQATDRTVLAKKIYSESLKTDIKKYLAWDMGEAEITLKGNYVTVRQTGQLRFPFREPALVDESGGIEASVKYKNQRIAPMVFIRNCRRVMGGK